MRLSLRSKILAAVVLAPVTLTAASLWTVNHRLSDRAIAQMHEELQRASITFENTMAERGDALAKAAQVIVRDPRFYSALALPVAHDSRHYRRTVQGVASDFTTVSKAELFEVLDVEGAVVASVGKASSTEAGRAWVVEAAMGGEETSGLLVEPGALYQATVTPVVLHGRRLGALLLGIEIGGSLARELQMITRSDVTFVSNHDITGTTVEDPSALVSLVGPERGPTSVGTFDLEHAQGDDGYLTLTRPIPGAANRSQLYVMQRSLEAETAHLREMQGALIQLGFFTVAAALALGLFISARITRPILEVVRGAEEMERGNYDHPITVGERDEIGYLANRFREMRRHEQVYVNSLQEVARLKSEFISVASHELRTPVSIIRGFSEMFADGTHGRLTVKQREAIQAIGQSVEGLTRLTEDATRLAQIEGQRMILYKEEHSVGKIIEQAATAAVAEGRGRKVEVSIEVPADLGVVVVDGPRLLEAVLQLTRNAIRFTPDGGSVDVVARRAGERLEVEVRDTGIGIAEDKLPHLFDRAFSMRDSVNHHSSSTLEFNSAGLGLGLAIAHGIAEAHGGSINVESRVGEGSRFTIRIPIEVAKASHHAA